MMFKITPNLWFDNQAEEAVNFYTSVFGNSKVKNVVRYGNAGARMSGKPQNSVMTIAFELNGQEFVALNGGPQFKFTPAISFYVNCETKREIDDLWNALSQDGSVLMELQKYPFSDRYGRLTDKFGLSWQLNLTNHKQVISPCLMFVGEQAGKAEDAMNFYTSLFIDSRIDRLDRYSVNEKGKEWTVKHAEFTLDGQRFIAMDGDYNHQFTFTPAVSFMVNCRTQHEVDEFWKKFSEGGEPSSCGWIQDRFDVSWQIVPIILDEMMNHADKERSERVMEAMLRMKKIDIDGLIEAYGREG